MFDQLLLAPTKLVTSGTLGDNTRSSVNLEMLSQPRPGHLEPAYWAQDVTACVTIRTDSVTVL